MKDAFSSELEMSNMFINIIHNYIPPIQAFQWHAEVEGFVGIPDFVFISKLDETSEVTISFELKLSNWKKALNQAFRYRTFSNVSYVVMDEAFIHRPQNNLQLFTKYNIGLVSLNTNGDLKIIVSPTYNQPFSDNMMALLWKKLLEDDDTIISKFEETAEDNVECPYKRIAGTY